MDSFTVTAVLCVEWERQSTAGCWKGTESSPVLKLEYHTELSRGEPCQQMGDAASK